MCGLAGVMYADARPVERGLLAALGRAIAHRGPDGEGFLEDAGVGMVHRRLSIIDLSGGGQPIGNEDGSVQTVFNGEIYNYQELREDLLKRGHQLRTRSDTEVLVHLYEDLGPDMVTRLRGMFAFAIWDRPRRTLFLARDRLGIKPLYTYSDSEKIIFASEIKAILAVPGVPRDLDPAALEDYFAFGFVPGPRSIFKGITKLQPAHTLTIVQGQAPQPPRNYWQLSFVPDTKPSVAEWQEAVRAKVAEAVRLHLIADVPVGAFLSGGMDSSVMVASTAGATKGQLQTFSIGFQEDAFSELPYARLVADRFGTKHTEQIVTPNAVELLDELSLYYDEPFADSSALPTYLVSKLTAQSVKVALSGDGGDEAFGGYARYAHDLKEAWLRSKLPAWLRRGVLGPLGHVWPKADWLPRPLRAKTLLTNLALEPGRAYANTLAVCRPPLRRQLLHADVLAQLNGHDPAALVAAAHGLASAEQSLDGMLTADVNTVLPDDFLVKVDRASMAVGLEVRPPLLDHELLELTARIPAEYKIHAGQTKWIFKEAYKDRLPPEVVYRKKQGFELPVNDWLRGPLRPMVEDAVLKPGGPLDALVNRDVAAGLYRQHCAGVGRHGPVLWSLLVLARWAERYLRAA